MALADNLIAYWELDDATDSAGSNNLTNNGATFSTGKVGNAGFFASASSQYMEIADNADISSGNIDITFQAWVRISSTGATQNLVAKWGSTTGQQEYILYFNSSSTRFTFGVRDSGGFFTSVAANNFGAPSVDTWYLVHGWHDAANDLLGISVNAGTADSTTGYTSGIQDTTESLCLGAQEAGTSSFLDGALDEVAIWKRVLTSSERTELYNSGSGRDYTYVSGGGGGGSAVAGALANFNIIIQ